MSWFLKTASVCLVASQVLAHSDDELLFSVCPSGNPTNTRCTPFTGCPVKPNACLDHWCCKTPSPCLHHGFEKKMCDPRVCEPGWSSTCGPNARCMSIPGRSAYGKCCTLCPDGSEGSHLCSGDPKIMEQKTLMPCGLDFTCTYVHKIHRIGQCCPNPVHGHCPLVRTSDCSKVLKTKEAKTTCATDSECPKYHKCCEECGRKFCIRAQYNKNEYIELK